MGTCHIQQQSILSVIFILPSFLVIIHHIIVNTIEFPNYSLFLSSILSSCNCRLKPPQNLESITLVVLYSSRRRLVVINIEHLLQIVWFVCRTPVSHEEKHNRVRMVLGLDILVHPYLT
ncbi:AC5 protein [Bhendi yellow vein India virus [India:Sonipat:OY96:2005]]|nr:AC5 protein [Bhendi yellow vein India virus [India:Sonipat:OY96:2005]]